MARRSVNPANPQSWNRYAYVLNNPLSLIDPLGLDWIYFYDEDTGCFEKYDSEGVVLGNHSVEVTAGPNIIVQCFGKDRRRNAMDDSGHGGGSGSGNPPSPQAPTPQQPQKKPCPAASRAASTVEALDAAGDALVSFNLAAGHFALAFVSVSATCLDPTPFEPLTCGAGVVAGGFLSARGTALTGIGVFFTKRSYSAFKQAITCGPGS